MLAEADRPVQELADGRSSRRLDLSRELDQARTDWRPAVEDELRLRAQAAQPPGRDLGASAPGLAGLVGLAAVSVLTLLLLSVHESRASLRRWWRAIGSSPILVLLVGLGLALAGCSGGGGPSGPTAEASARESAPELDRPDLEAQRLEQRELVARKSEAELTARLGRLLDRRLAEAVPVAAASTEPDRATRLRQAALKAQADLRELAVQARTIQKLAADRTRALSTARALETSLAARAASDRRRGLVSWAGLVGLASVLLLGALLPLRAIRRRAAEHALEESAKCPCCLEVQGLQVVTSDVQDERYPDPRFIECRECGYEFPESYKYLPRLSFPTIGVRGSGKTHWLATAYDLIKNGNVPIPASVKKLPSMADDDFDAMIGDILEEREGARPTQLGLPYPLVFHIQDLDRFARRAVLANMFDFAGVHTQRRIKEDIFRRRALLCDGFTLFLDPTQVTPQNGRLGIEDQIRAMAHFHDEMRALRDIPPTEKIDIPIAVCVSKIDLLMAASPSVGRQAIEFAHALLATSGPRLTLDQIQERSQICARMVPLMFPGWNLERSLQENFGGRYMFFPLTPVSLIESEFGETDLSRRTIAPFGVLEPLIWLLHMHGYAVFN
jgi:hypothetical protein